MYTLSGMNDRGHSKYSMSANMYSRRGGRGGFGTPRTAPPDLPSLLLDGRIVYLGMPVSQDLNVVHLIFLGEFTFQLYLLYPVFDHFPVGLPQIVPAVCELIVAQFLWLNYDNDTKPIYLYLNSTGIQVMFAYVGLLSPIIVLFNIKFTCFYWFVCVIHLPRMRTGRLLDQIQTRLPSLTWLRYWYVVFVICIMNVYY